MEFFLHILKLFLQRTYLFSPHWLTLLCKSSFEFVASFSFIQSLVIHLILWSLTRAVGRTRLLLSSLLELRSCSAVPGLCCCCFLGVFMVCRTAALSYACFSPLFLLFVSSLLLLSSFGYMLGKLTVVATVMVDTVPSVSCQRHCTLHHVPSVEVGTVLSWRMLFIC